MHRTLTRREALLGIASTTAILTAQPSIMTVETHVHLFDPARVPYAPTATYKPPAYTLEDHRKLADAAPLAHAVIAHPEPYQDDHRLLDDCFNREPRPGYFKATCLFDPFRDDTPARIRALTKRWPKKFVAMRIHAVSRTPENTGPIRNRDLKDPRMLACWRELASLGLAVQMHFIPAQAPNIRALATRFRDLPVILDHMGRPAQGTEAAYNEVLKLAELPRVILKYSNWAEYKGDLQALTRRLYDAFGASRMIWGVVGNTPEEFRKQSARFEDLLSFAPAADRAAIRGGNALKLFFS
jgi:predicted TIM-barrel fold metal-dependent hydrolase